MEMAVVVMTLPLKTKDLIKPSSQFSWFRIRSVSVGWNGNVRLWFDDLGVRSG